MKPDLTALVFCDIDGCLNSGKGAPFDLGTLGRIRDKIAELLTSGIGVTLCSGRPQPYVEAIAQILAIDLPYICENGALIHDPMTDRATSLVGQTDLRHLVQLRSRLIAQPDLLAGFSIEPGKEACVSLTGPAFATLSTQEVDTIIARLQSLAPDGSLSFSYSSSAIDITPLGITKASGVSAVCHRLVIPYGRTAAIGDGQNDLAMLSAVAFALCPANGHVLVRQSAGYIAQQSHALGTLECLSYASSYFG